VNHIVIRSSLLIIEINRWRSREATPNNDDPPKSFPYFLNLFLARFRRKNRNLAEGVFGQASFRSLRHSDWGCQRRQLPAEYVIPALVCKRPSLLPSVFLSLSLRRGYTGAAIRRAEAARREFASVFERKEHSLPSRLIPVRMQDTQDPLSRTRECALVLPCLFMLTFYGSYEPDFLADVPLLNWFQCGFFLSPMDVEEQSISTSHVASVRWSSSRRRFVFLRLNLPRTC
jgi:hypothetical protein